MSQGGAKVGEFYPESRRKPIEHGTQGGYRAHFRHKVPLCPPCRQAGALARKEVSRPKPPARVAVPVGAHADEPWRERAACRNHPRLLPVVWDDHPGPGHREDPDTRARRVAVATKVCRTECPVRAECLRDVDLRYDDGIRGGEDLRDLREAAKRGRRRSA